MIRVNFLFCIVLLFAMTLPMLVLYTTSTLGPLLSSDLHFDSSLLGYLIMSSFGLAAVLSLWAGAIVDYLGSRYTLLMLFSSVGLAFTLIATVESFYSLLVAAAICGIAQALANPVTNLLIAQQVPPEQKAGIVGLKQAGVQLAALIAGLMLPSIALQYGWRVAFGIVVPITIFFCLSVSFVTPKKHIRAQARLKLLPPNSLLQRLMIIQFLIGTSLSAFVTYLPTFAIQQNMALPLADTLIAVFGAVGMISRIVLTPMGAKLKDESLLLFMLAAIAAVSMAITMNATPDSHWQLWAGAIGVGLTAVATNAIAMSMLVRDPAFGPVTFSSSLVSVAFFAGFALGPPLFACVSIYFENLFASWNTLIGALILACVMAIVLAFARRHKVEHRRV
ncbi:MFS transporter [Nitrosomonas communis]|uniref:MFS transporter n=3 Tax=Nitrosomonadaceae TaxID=206379 RepID=A0A0F7KE48_9PROT|nr:MFS transporter [Nitrosomonas communis]AKH37112.1 MFS transporter [Nitrosomonas communis]